MANNPEGLFHQRNSISLGPIATSRDELIALTKAWAAISFAFAILLSGSVFSPGFLFLFAVSGFTVGLGFIFHEVAHKLVAQRFGCSAEFRSFDSMLLFAVLMSFFGFLFAAPGAVMISGPVGRARNGKISAAGPLTNILLAALFGVLAITQTNPGIRAFASYGMQINSWLALFNMIPFWNFDGKKVLEWSKPLYFIIVGISVLLVWAKGIFSFFGISIEGVPL